MATTHKHPDQAKVKALVQEILSVTRNAKDWNVEMLDYEFYSSTYKVKLTLKGNSAVTKVPSEWINEVWDGGGKFSTRRIKHALRDSVKAFGEIEE